MAQAPRPLIHAGEVTNIPELPFQHSLNPRSKVYLRSLSALAGLQRLGLHLGRLPPGAESFAFHYHHYEEEFVYILSGRGVAEIGDQEYEVGPGDFMLFTAPSVGHHLRNPFEADLVYLMGGESHEVEIGEFPRLKKRAVFEKGKDAYIIDLDSTRPFFENRGAT